MTTKKTGISPKEMGKGLARWFREMRSELKKVVWPSKKQLINNCAIAIVMMIVCGIIIGAFDQLALFLVMRIIDLGTLIGA